MEGGFSSSVNESHSVTILLWMWGKRGVLDNKSGDK